MPTIQESFQAVLTDAKTICRIKFDSFKTSPGVANPDELDALMNETEEDFKSLSDNTKLNLVDFEFDEASIRKQIMTVMSASDFSGFAEQIRELMRMFRVEVLEPALEKIDAMSPSVIVGKIKDALTVTKRKITITINRLRKEQHINIEFDPQFIKMRKRHDQVREKYINTLTAQPDRFTEGDEHVIDQFGKTISMVTTKSDFFTQYNMFSDFLEEKTKDPPTA